MPVLSTVEAQLSLHKRIIVKAAPEARNGKKPTANHKQAKVSKLMLQYSVSYKRAP